MGLSNISDQKKLRKNVTKSPDELRVLLNLLARKPDALHGIKQTILPRIN